MGATAEIAPQFLYGAAVTLFMAGAAWVIATVPALAIAYVVAFDNTALAIVKTLSRVFIVLPFLALLFWVHYPLQESLGVVWDPLYTCVGLLATHVFFAVSNLLGTELRAARGEHEQAAAVLGLSLHQLTRSVLFPLALARSVPQMLSVGIATIHMTMFGSLIGVEELFRVTLRLNASLLKPVELFTVMAFVYAAVCLPLYFFARFWRTRLERTL